MTTKSECLKRIRAESAYPAFRMFIEGVKYLAFTVAVLATVVAVLPRARISPETRWFTIVGSVALVFITMVLTDASLMLADVADAVLDMTSKN